MPTLLMFTFSSNYMIVGIVKHFCRISSTLINLNKSTTSEISSNICNLNFRPFPTKKGIEMSSGKKSRGRPPKPPVKIEFDNEEEVVDVKRPRKNLKEEELAVGEVDKRVVPGPSGENRLHGGSDQPQPPNWAQVVENIRTMRVDNPAPVDTMGCERTMDEKAEPKVKRFQTLISLLLSSQTKDEVTFAAMGRLKDYGCTPQKMLEISESDLKALLKPVGFFNKKAVNVQKVSQILLDKYDGDIPNTSEGLMALPGFGPKMTYICMQVAWGINEGIGVDTHVHRISERLGWTSTKGKKKLVPEDTRKQLEAWLPKEVWQDVNILLVGFGQTICSPINPKCSQCLNKLLCPYGRRNVKTTSK